MNYRITRWDVIKRYPGAVKRLLNGGRDPSGVTVGGDGDGPTVIHLN